MLIVKNLKSSDIEETIDRMEQIIKHSQMIMLPGGFSGGDEPDGSGKFIATTFRNPRIAEAVNELLKNRDGLMLGICNGFQALIKLGLVPYGEIRELKPTDPTLTFNTIGRHISHMAYTRVTSVKSPWFANVNAGDVFAVPVSHGEGRFMADAQTVKALAENGQIATQYVDLNGNPGEDITYTSTVRFVQLRVSLLPTDVFSAKWDTAKERAKTSTKTFRLQKISRYLKAV